LTIPTAVTTTPCGGGFTTYVSNGFMVRSIEKAHLLRNYWVVVTVACEL
jgi:hypothetical protein